MTDLAIRDEHGTELVPASAASSALVLWAYEARQAAQIATSLAKTSFVPVTLRGKPEDITAAILAGQELGLKPMATLRSMDVIQGTPALRAHAMRGLVQSHGHKIQLVSSTETRCVMRGRRKDEGDDEWQTVTWTIERAAKLQLTGKSEWKKQPQTMLVARATGEICRLVASDVLHAMPYAVEELGDDEPMLGMTRIEAEVSKPARRTVRRAAALPAAPAEPPPAVEEPPFEDQTDPAEPVGVEPMSEPMRKKMWALLREQNMTDRDEVLAYLSVTIDREIRSSTELSKEEGIAVIDALLDRQAPAEPALDGPDSA
jgi:hypothetical protein